jgi:8-oxo-dGTP diphosphatase
MWRLFLKGCLKKKYKVVAGLIRKNGKIFLAKRPKNKEMGGLWEFPGGKLEKGESWQTALKRELKEELDIEIKEALFLGKVEYDYENFTVELSLLEVKDFDGKIKLKEAEDGVWIKPEELSKYKLTPADQKLIEKLKKYFFTR